MWSNNDVFDYAISKLSGKTCDIWLIDFVRLCSNVSFEMRKRHGDFRDQLVKRFSQYPEDYQNKQNRRWKWTVEIFHSQIIDKVIHFNETFKSVEECHGIVFLSLDKELLPYQEGSLKRCYINRKYFHLERSYLNRNWERIWHFLEGKKAKSVVQNKLMNFYPLLLHVNSISTGIVLNYYYSYLNRQIGSTNSIFIKLRFKENLPRKSFPSIILIILDTFIENTFLEKCPSTIEYNSLIPIQSNILQFKYHSIIYQSSNNIETILTYTLIGINDLGRFIERIRIWQENLPLNLLTSIELNDDIRGWKEEYQSSSSNILRENEESNLIFENREDWTRKCQFFPIVDAPVGNGLDSGVNTMKLTTKECYDRYMDDLENSFTSDGRRISKVLVAPVYYIIMPSSCRFGPSDIDGASECDEIIVKGTIIDPDQSDKIRLARVNKEVLRSAPMIHYNRYLRRTYYYVDEMNDKNEMIRYLFCGEYPNILSTLDHLKQSGEISQIEKRDEYLRFCNMLNRLVQFNNLSESIKLIQFNDEENNIQYADFKPLWNQIKEDIDQWYQPTDDDDETYSLDIESKIVSLERTNNILLFYTDKGKEDPSIVTLINDIKEKVQLKDFIVEDAQGNIDLIEREKQILFICTGRRDDQINHSIINSIEQKINKSGVLRDVFILVNDAIEYFPCRFIRSIPFLTFDLHRRSSYLTSEEIEQIIFYLNNMNVMSNCYTGDFEDINHFLNKSPLQCTSVGLGCGAAFYFNYAKLLTSSIDHRCRIELINKEIVKENLINDKCLFVRKWIFIIPSTIENTNQILLNGLTINEDEQKRIGLKLSIWKAIDPKFEIADLRITVGGVYERSYSPLTIYQLTNLTNGKTFYFPMEIPSALHGLQNQYENILSHFNFGRFDPSEQGLIFCKKVKEFFSNDQDKTCQENIILIPLENCHTSITYDAIGKFEQAKILLETLWKNLSSFNEDI